MEERADSLYSRGTDGEWADIAEDSGVAMELVGMGITVADLTEDGALDGYVSDLGGNEFLVRRDTDFALGVDTVASRIRPLGAVDSVVLSSWASGAADVNLDGLIDLVVVNGGMPLHAVEDKIPGSRIELDDPPALLIGIGHGRYANAWPSAEVVWVGDSPWETSTMMATPTSSSPGSMTAPSCCATTASHQLSTSYRRRIVLRSGLLCLLPRVRGRLHSYLQASVLAGCMPLECPLGFPCRMRPSRSCGLERRSRRLQHRMGVARPLWSVATPKRI